MRKTYARSLRQLFGALLLGGAMASVLAAGAGQRATVAGVDIYYGMVPAQLAAKHPLSHEERTMHGGVKGAKDARVYPRLGDVEPRSRSSGISAGRFTVIHRTIRCLASGD